MTDHTSRLPGTLVRGGTSKCWLFEQSEMPEDLGEIAEILIDVYGADDPHHLDGVGGGTSVTSKAAVISDSPAAGIDIDYLFAQVAIGAHRVEWGSNCGNCATAVALYATRTRPALAVDAEPVTVRLRNVNTGAVLTAVVHPDDEVATVPGVLGPGVAVDLAFRFDLADVLERAWPTGHAIDLLPPGYAALSLTLCTGGAPVAIALAADLGLPAAASIDEVAAVVPTLRRLRALAAVRMGLAETLADAADAVPKVGVVGPAVDYVTTLGERVSASDYDLSVRMLSMNAPHPTVGLTTAVTLAVAAARPGTLLESLGIPVGPSLLRIGTPGGVVACATETSPGGGMTVLLHRAARHLADALIATHRPPVLATHG